jgi:hypothetical protein
MLNLPKNGIYYSRKPVKLAQTAAAEECCSTSYFCRKNTARVHLLSLRLTPISELHIVGIVRGNVATTVTTFVFDKLVSSFFLPPSERTNQPVKHEICRRFASSARRCHHAVRAVFVL